jgi:TolB-like protein/DNA-binding winged helix-turn-helix (wHTH) protein/Tfp pilus assembly protein PilF
VSSPAVPRLVRFGVFEADLQAHELRKQGVQIKLQDQPFQILAFLLEHAGEIVTREQLRQKLWPADTFVDVDNSVNAAINRLREALGDSAESPRFVETLPRRGYRFVAPVTAVNSPEGASALEDANPATQVRREEGQTGGNFKARSTLRKVSLASGLVVSLVVTSVWAWQKWRARMPAPEGPITSIAVLPLENLSGDKEQEYFADGMTDQLITDLAKISAIRVISRTSTIHYKRTEKPLPQIGQELNVDVVVEGTVTRAGSRVRITAQLVRATTDRHLWAGEYDGDLGDILKLQGQVARAITDEIQIKLTPQEDLHLASARPVNPESHDAYLKGRYYLEKWSADGTKVAIGYFQQAIEKDPNSALAYAGLAECYMHWPPLPLKESHAKAKAAALKAVELDETLGEAHASLALIRFVGWDFPGAEREFKRAIELDPSFGEAHHEYSHYLMQMGRSEESLAEASRFLELDPLSPVPNLHLGWYYLFAKKYDPAMEQLQKTLKMDPNYVEAHSWLGQTYEQKKMYEQAVAEFEKAIALSGGKPYYRALLGHAYAISGKRDQAHDIIATLKSESSPSSPIDAEIAIIYAGLGNHDQAFEWWGKAYHRRSGYLTFSFRVNPMFDEFHSDHRFADLLRRIGLPR